MKLAAIFPGRTTIMFHLVIQTGKNKGRRIALPDREVTIGRDDGCLVRLTSDDVGPQHCAIKPGPVGPLLRDLGSPSGTLVNSKAIEGERLLQAGDIVQIGPVQFQVAMDKKAGSKSRVDDDEIASWLTESDTSGSKLADTSIARPPDMWNNPWPDRKQKFDSLAEEAQDIIRRHLDRKRHE
jgi:pSer/pThr/pTyr-binding forkhead associated (FHA) protein